MNLSNKEIANLLRDYADKLEIYAENPYRIRAYRRAARTIIKLDKSIYHFINNNIELTTLPHIGPGIAKLIREIIEIKKIPEIITYKNKQKPFRNELLQIKGLGKKKIALLNDEGINSIESLRKSIHDDHLKNKFTWFTESFKKKLLYGIDNPKRYEKFIKFNTANLLINHIQSKLLSIDGSIIAIPTSNYRRKCELVGNIDWLLKTTNHTIIQSISEWDIIKEIVNLDDSSITVILRSSQLMIFHIIDPKVFGIALLLFTGSSSHVEALQKYFINKKINLNYQSLENNKNYFDNINKYFSDDTEDQIYKKIGLSYIEPELRENHGEIIAAEKNKLPVLITLNDIKGDLHSHTNETDGIEPLEVMVEAAVELGYEYFAITDHSKRLTITNGLNEERLLKQIKQIDQLNAKYSNFRILKSIEVDILEDGSLDLSNDILKELDIRVCSIHSKFKLPEGKQTERIIRAMDNPYFNILGHMTGRLLISRPPYSLQIEKIFNAAKERNCFIELNSQPARLDINDLYCKQAKEMGVKIAISSDAHSVKELNFMPLGINQARKGWLEKNDVINTRNFFELIKLIKRK